MLSIPALPFQLPPYGLPQSGDGFRSVAPLVVLWGAAAGAALTALTPPSERPLSRRRSRLLVIAAVAICVASWETGLQIRSDALAMGTGRSHLKPMVGARLAAEGLAVVALVGALAAARRWGARAAPLALGALLFGAWGRAQANTILIDDGTIGGVKLNTLLGDRRELDPDWALFGDCTSLRLEHRLSGDVLLLETPDGAAEIPLGGPLLRYERGAAEEMVGEYCARR